MRRLLWLPLLVLPAALPAQSSQFGVNGLGLITRQLSVRAIGTGGGFALFDPVTPINPAAVSEYGRFSTSFTSLQNYRSSTGPTESASGRDTRFPLVTVGGTIPRSTVALGLSFATYSDRDFSLFAQDTVDLRGVPVAVRDTLTSAGGISDIGLAAAWRHSGWAIGGGLHIITGSSRLSLRRTFGDTLYQPVSQRAEVSYAGAGFSAGITRLLGRHAAAAAYVRMDGHASIDRDSVSVGRVNLPVSFGGSLRWRPSARLDLASTVSTTRWGSADADVRALGGTGARNIVDASFGGEWLRSAREPENRPLRFGAHFRTLAFPVTSGVQPREIGLSLGSGAVLARERATTTPTALLDVSLEHAWRSATGGYRESAWLLAFGVTVRP